MVRQLLTCKYVHSSRLLFHVSKSFIRKCSYTNLIWSLTCLNIWLARGSSILGLLSRNSNRSIPAPCLCITSWRNSSFSWTSKTWTIFGWFKVLSRLISRGTLIPKKYRKNLLLNCITRTGTLKGLKRGWGRGQSVIQGLLKIFGWSKVISRLISRGTLLLKNHRKNLLSNCIKRSGPLEGGGRVGQLVIQGILKIFGWSKVLNRQFSVTRVKNNPNLSI